MTRQMMSHKELLDLVKWIEAARESIADRRPTYAAVAVAASASLDATYSAANVRAAARAIDFEWRKAEKDEPALERRVRMLEARVIILAAGLRQVRSANGMYCPMWVEDAWSECEDHWQRDRLLGGKNGDRTPPAADENPLLMSHTARMATGEH